MHYRTFTPGGTGGRPGPPARQRAPGWLSHRPGLWVWPVLRVLPRVAFGPILGLAGCPADPPAGRPAPDPAAVTAPAPASARSVPPEAGAPPAAAPAPPAIRLEWRPPPEPPPPDRLAPVPASGPAGAPAPPIPVVPVAAPVPAPRPGPESPDEPWSIPARGVLAVHLAKATRTATATLLDGHGRPIPQRARVFEVGPGVRIDLEMLEESPAKSLTLLVKSGGVERSWPVRLE